MEIPGMVFVGKPDARLTESIMMRVRKSRCTATIVRPYKNEVGFCIEFVNQHEFVVLDFDGLCLPTKVGTFERPNKA